MLIGCCQTNENSHRIAGALYVKHRINRIKDADAANIAAAQEVIDFANRHNSSSNSAPDQDDVREDKKDGVTFWDFMAIILGMGSLLFVIDLIMQEL